MTITFIGCITCPCKDPQANEQMRREEQINLVDKIGWVILILFVRIRGCKIDEYYR